MREIFQKPNMFPIPTKNFSSRNGLVKNKLLKLLQRTNQNIKNGRFANFSKKEKHNIYKRLKRYSQRFSLGVRCTAAGFVLVVTTSVSSVAQTFTKIETTTSPFIFYDNPVKNLSVSQYSHATFGDIDGDGDLDMFFGEDHVFTFYNANIYYSENTGTATNPIYASPSTNPFGLSATAGGSTPTLIDLDDDGDLDMFTGDRNGDILYFENTGSSSTPSFAAPATNPFGISVGSYIYMPKPVFADIDDDGDIDFFMINDYGELFYYQHQDLGAGIDFTFQVTNPFNWENGWDAPIYANLAIADLDLDGDLDLISVGYDYGSYSNVHYFHENFGDNQNPNYFPAPVPNAENLQLVATNDSPVFVDIDGDGDMDYISGNFQGTFILQGLDSATAPATYKRESAKVAQESSLTFGDIDGDGDLDAFVGEYNQNINFYKNNGTATSPDFDAIPMINPYGLTTVGNYSSAPTLIDLDGDADMDIVVGADNGNFYFFENTSGGGTPAFAAPITNPFGLSDAGSYLTPVFVDINGDGDLDAFAGNSAGNIIYFENTSNGTPSFFAQITNPFGFSDIGTRSSISFVDIDNDGDYDAFVGEYDGNTNFFENLGNATTPNFALSPAAEPFGISDIGKYSKPVFADLDGDNDMDAFVGEYSGNFIFFENAVVLPVELSFFQAKRVNDKTRLIWQTDSEQNNQGFEIQRAVAIGGELTWQNIGFVEGRGTTAQVQMYSFEDNLPKNSLNYYRLKQIDFDGKYEFSKIEVVDFGTSNDAWNVFPNPVNGLLRISGNENTRGSFQLINVLGQVVRVQDFKEGESIQINVSDLPAGQYQLKILASDSNHQVVKPLSVFRE